MTRYSSCLCLGLFSVFAAAGPASAQDLTMNITLTFDPVASATLSERSERVIVSAFYYGNAARPDVAVDEAGQVFLGGEEHIVLPVDQRITLGGNLANAALADVEEPLVNINLFTARRSHLDNLIACDIVDEGVAAVAAQDRVLNCVLLPR
jgi:hypothetical protein